MKKILICTPFLAGEELISWMLNRLTGLLPFYRDLYSGLPGKIDEDWFTDNHFTVAKFTPTESISERLLSEKVLPIFLVRNIYDLLIDHYRYFSGKNSVFWREYLAKMSKSEGISILIAGNASSGFTLSGMDICFRQMQEILRFSTRYPCCLISYEKLLYKPTEQLQRLADFIGVELTEDKRHEIENGLTREIEVLTRRNSSSKSIFSYGLSCEFHDILTDIHLDMIENILKKYAPDLGLLSETLGFQEATAQSDTLIRTRRKRIFVATVFKSGTKLIEYVISKLTALPPLKFEEEAGSDYENADLIRFERGSFFIWHSFPSDEVKAKIREEGAKPIFLVRNIYDLLVAQYFHFADDVDASIGRTTNSARYFDTMGRDEGISLILCGATSERFHWHGFGYSLRQIQEMLLFSKEYPCHIIIFDRLVLNKRSEIERLAEYLEVDLTPDLLHTILNGSFLETMREARIKNFGSGKHFRKGIPGDHVNMLKSHHYHMINHIKMTHTPMLDKLCEELGYGDITTPYNGAPESQNERELTPDEIQSEATRLSLLSGWEGGPIEGWQYPFDLGHKIITRTYTEVQAELHPWRRDVLLNNLDKLFAGRYHELSVLDLGACEGSMALGLWERGVLNITCVEARSINVEKARFVFKTKKANIQVIQDDVLNFLARDIHTYDLVLFMGLLYHLLDPFQAMKLTAQRTHGLLAMETVVADPHDVQFKNDPDYSPSSGGFFVRHDSMLSNTAGLSNLELWPNREGLEMLLTEAGFADIKEMDYGLNPIRWYKTKQRVMLIASHRSGVLC